MFYELRVRGANTNKCWHLGAIQYQIQSIYEIDLWGRGRK
jgi:hypothetical protein